MLIRQPEPSYPPVKLPPWLKQRPGAAPSTLPPGYTLTYSPADQPIYRDPQGNVIPRGQLPQQVIPKYYGPNAPTGSPLTNAQGQPLYQWGQGVTTRPGPSPIPPTKPPVASFGGRPLVLPQRPSNFPGGLPTSAVGGQSPGATNTAINPNRIYRGPMQGPGGTPGIAPRPPAFSTSTGGGGVRGGPAPWDPSRNAQPYRGPIYPLGTPGNVVSPSAPPGAGANPPPVDTSELFGPHGELTDRSSNLTYNPTQAAAELKQMQSMANPDAYAGGFAAYQQRIKQLQGGYVVGSGSGGMGVGGGGAFGFIPHPEFCGCSRSLGLGVVAA